MSGTYEAQRRQNLSTVARNDFGASDDEFFAPTNGRTVRLRPPLPGEIDEPISVHTLLGFSTRMMVLRPNPPDPTLHHVVLMLPAGEAEAAECCSQT